ncbi:MAG: hypothetical protein GKS03_11625 [Alphaproteobacteria bacterium]|nr:hypothetical protein [Alphaproteobacteria bacterium]
MISPEISDVLASLENLDSVENFAKLLGRSCEALGCGSYAYTSLNTETILRSKLSETVDDMMVVSNLDSSWMEHYIKENYSISDPVMMDAIKARQPIIWTEDYRFDTLSADEAQMMADAHDFGVERGMAVPIHGPSGELGMLCVYAEMQDKDFRSHVDATKHEMHLIAHYAHSVAQTKLRRAGAPKPILLTDREVEILRWTAEGKTAWEIGSILTISERTVNFHLQNAMVKFGVHNKTHAAAKAMSYGMLSA